MKHTRESLVRRMRRIVAEIDQYLVDLESWNENRPEARIYGKEEKMRSLRDSLLRDIAKAEAAS